MKFEILTIPPFDKQFKKLCKKYTSLKSNLIELSLSLIEKPNQGTSLGNNCFKIRLSISSKAKGKSGGARIITHLYYSENKIYLLAIYDKSEISNITDKEIINLIDKIK
jgi:hypothetical protein